MQPLLSTYARARKLRFFLPFCRASDRILEIGAGSGWWSSALRERGFEGCVTLDLIPPADVVGDIRAWRTLGLQPASFDVCIAFEVVEHVPCVDEARDLLKPGGLLLVTTPVPSADNVLRLLEHLGLNQPRVTPHLHLRDVRRLPGFATVAYRRVAGLSQWGAFRKTA